MKLTSVSTRTRTSRGRTSRGRRCSKTSLRMIDRKCADCCIETEQQRYYSLLVCNELHGLGVWCGVVCGGVVSCGLNVECYVEE